MKLPARKQVEFAAIAFSIWSIGFRCTGLSVQCRIDIGPPGEHDSPGPDGLKMDSEGNIVSARTGIWFISSTGKLLGRIDTDGLSTPNACYGGDDWKTLFFVGNHALFSVPVKIPGVPIPTALRR